MEKANVEESLWREEEVEDLLKYNDTGPALEYMEDTEPLYVDKFIQTEPEVKTLMASCSTRYSETDPPPLLRDQEVQCTILASTPTTSPNPKANNDLQIIYGYN